MNKLLLVTLLFLLYQHHVHAQITIDAISTDTVDLFSKQDISTESNNNTGVILASTLLLPGTGHQYIGRAHSALSYVSADIISLVCALFFKSRSTQLTADAKAYAALYAGTVSRTTDDRYWQMLGHFATMSAYNNTMDLVRDPGSKYTDVNLLWSWEDESYQKKYVSIQKNAKKVNIIGSFFLGAMVLNRVVAFIDLKYSLKHNTFLQGSPISMHPFVTPNLSAPGLALFTTF